jgi:peptidoglycan/xylan/chitin deacetylase (PgdA/CDA1 family)
VGPEAFERQVAWLASGRVRVMGIDELVALPPTEDALAITFDDGFTNFSEIAAPRLLAHGLPVTLFVVSRFAGRTNAWNGRIDPRIPHLPLLGWTALARLCEQGVTLGAHGRTHVDLTRLAPAAMEDEVAGSADEIQCETGIRPQAFAYPYGRLTRAVSQAVAETFRYGCTTEFATVSNDVGPAELPRLDMFYFRHSHRLEEWGTPALMRFIKRRNRIRRVRQTIAKAPWLSTL